MAFANRFLVCFGWGLLLSVSLTGCGPDGRDVHPIAGTVTLDGQPLPSGDILFEPADESRGADAGKIVDGKFAFNAAAGSGTIRIQSQRETGKTITGAMGETVSETQEVVPANYNSQSELMVDIPAGGKSDFSFDLKSQ